MTTSKMPTTAEDWGAFLASKSLPSPFRVGKVVLNSIRDKDLPYSKIAEKLNSDPVLAYYIMSKANKERPGSNPTSKTLDHAISMIGIEPLTQLINQLPFQKVSTEDISAFYYVRALSSSLYAAYLGRAMCRVKHYDHTEDIYWSSLFLGVPIWTMWRFATPEMRLIRYAIRNNFKLPKTAEKEVLGCTLLEASSEMIRALGVSDLVKDCFNPKYQLSHRQWIRISKLIDEEGNFTHPTDDRDLMMTLQTPQFMIQVANMVAHFATHDWYSKQCLRAQRIMAAYLKVPLSEAIRISHEAAAEMSQSHPIPGVMLPAAKLFLEPRLRVKADPTAEDHKIHTPLEKTQASEPKTETPVKKAPASAPDTPPEAPKAEQPQTPPPETKAKAPAEQDDTLDNPVFKELTEIMIHRPEEFTDLHELMNAATQGLSYGIEFKRSLVGLINKDGSRLKTYYSTGCRENSEMATFETQIVRETIFGKLLDRPSSIWVKPDSSKKVIALIPNNFKQVIQSHEFFLMSVFVGKKPVAIFYADNNDQPLSNKQYKQFKYMCGAVSTALLHQANSKKKR